MVLKTVNGLKFRRRAEHNRDAARVRYDRTIEVILGLCGCHGQKERRPAGILLRVSLAKRVDHKRHLFYTTHRREPPETWRCQVFRHTGPGLCLLVGSLPETGHQEYRISCELGLYQWKRMPLGLCNATATLQILMAQALTFITNKYENLVMCYVDDVVKATTT